MDMPCTILLFLLFLTGSVSSHRVCSYQEVLDYLNLTSNNEVYTSTRPVVDYTHPTVVQLDFILYAILAVIEKTQTFTPFIWMLLMWNNEHISWDPSQFCGITEINVPRELLWKPDLFIYEMTENGKSSQNPYIQISYKGFVTMKRDIRAVSTCKMDVHKFPFDKQSCSITVGSAIHSVSEMIILPSSNSSQATEITRLLMQTQGDWEFINLVVVNDTFMIDDGKWNLVIYTIHMKRRPLLHIINFLLPILFFLCLDLSTFLISDDRGDKLGFKVTLLLAISVLLLILNEILPSASNRTPLIATYCIVVFALMLMSLLETIVVTHLMDKDSHTEETKTISDKEGIPVDHFEGTADKTVSPNSDQTTPDRPHELLSVAGPRKDVDGPQSADSHLLLMMLEVLREMRSLALLSSAQVQGGKPGYWTRVARKVNIAYFILYITGAVFFLALMHREWLVNF